MAKLMYRSTGWAGVMVALVSICPSGGCTPNVSSSFETLSVPDPELRAGRAALIIGWDREDRQGWVMNFVRVDGRTRSEWRRATQRPAVIYLDPGRRTLRLFVERRSRGRSQRPTDDRSLRYRLPPIELSLEEGEVHLCRLNVEGHDRQRPRARCTRLRSPSGREPREPRPAPADPRRRAKLLPNPFPPAAGPDDEAPIPDLLPSPYADPAQLGERMRRLEQRLDRVEETLEEVLEEVRARSSEPSPP